MKYIELATDTVLAIPPEVRVCPYCGGNLWARFEEFGQCDDGTWQAEGVTLECDSEPDLDDEDEKSVEAWNDFLSRHSEMPYVYWLPAAVAVSEFVNEHYRFKVE